MKKILLASASPRRKEILKNLNIEFEVVSNNLDESKFSVQTPEEFVKLLSHEKAKQVKNPINEDTIILGADTVVVYNNNILGKPRDEHQAYEYLNMLCGKVHEVYTGITLIDCHNNNTFVDYDVTKVYMRSYNEEEIKSYIKTKEPFDKAGAYAIQGYGAALVNQIKGDFWGVVGLPVSKLLEGIKYLGYDYFNHFHKF